jgi:hypothetical protein
VFSVDRKSMWPSRFHDDAGRNLARAKTSRTSAIGHHLLRRVLSDVLGRRVDLLGSGLRQSSESLATWEMGLAVMNGGRRVRQRTSRSTAILIKGVGGSLSDRLHLGRDVHDDGLGRFCDIWRPGQRRVTAGSGCRCI